MNEERNPVRRKHKKKKNATLLILEILLCIIALTAITFSFVLMLRVRTLEDENKELEAKVSIYEDPLSPYISSADVDILLSDNYDKAFSEGQNGVRERILDEIKKNLMDSNSAMETFKLLYPDELLIVDDNRYLFFPIDKNLKQHTYNDSMFGVSGDRILYNDPSVDIRTGIDVSKYQGKINWSKVASDDIDYAIVRVGYRGYSEGKIMEDTTFEDNIKGALSNKIDVGVYFLTQAVSEKEAEEEAQFVLDAIEPYNVTYPIVLDVEAVGGNDGRGNALSAEDRTKYSIAFLEKIKKAGYDVCIYGNLKTFLLMLDMKQLEDYSKWFAGYTDIPYFPYEMDIWQYTDKGKVSGISEKVDINIQFIK